MALTFGTQLGPHEITALSGKGGMGGVCRARDLKLKREVAIKILFDGISLDSDRISRFKHEARVLASLNHSNIANIYGLDEISGRHFPVFGIRCLLLGGLIVGMTAWRLKPLPRGSVAHVAVPLPQGERSPALNTTVLALFRTVRGLRSFRKDGSR